VYLVVQMSFCNNDAIFQDDNSPIHAVRSARSWFEEHKDALRQLPWTAESTYIPKYHQATVVSVREWGE